MSSLIFLFGGEISRMNGKHVRPYRRDSTNLLDVKDPLNSVDIPRRSFLRSALITMGYGTFVEALYPGSLSARSVAVADIIGQRELMMGLDGMSRSAIRGRNPFVNGHNAAAVIVSKFFCEEQNVSTETQQALLSFIERRLLKNRIYQAQPKEEADPDLIKGLVEDLRAGIPDLRRSGHNIIFATLSLKALNTMPEMVTPRRVEGLRKMVRSFRSPDKGVGIPDDENLPDLSDEKKYVNFVFSEYLDALDLYLHGRGHHGFAGHALTVGHALLELKRMGHQETANAGITAFWQFVGEARRGADRGGRRVKDGPSDFPTALDREFWIRFKGNRPKELVSSHLIKYPYSFYALAKEVEDETLKERALGKIFHLGAVS